MPPINILHEKLSVFAKYQKKIKEISKMLDIDIFSDTLRAMNRKELM